MKRRDVLLGASLVTIGAIVAVAPHWIPETDETSSELAHGDLDTIYSRLVFHRLRVASLMAHVFPGYSSCGRCKMPWSIVRGHSTEFSLREGLFPLCEDCWVDLGTPEDRMPYYRRLVIDEWKRPQVWVAVEKAVNEEQP